MRVNTKQKWLFSAWVLIISLCSAKTTSGQNLIRISVLLCDIGYITTIFSVHLIISFRLAYLWFAWWNISHVLKFIFLLLGIFHFTLLHIRYFSRTHSLWFLIFWRKPFLTCTLSSEQLQYSTVSFCTLYVATIILHAASWAYLHVNSTVAFILNALSNRLATKKRMMLSTDIKYLLVPQKSIY